MGHFEPNYDADNPILRAGQPVVETENLTDAFTREAESFITRYKAQPFFLYLSYNAVHSPMQGADAYMQKFAHIPGASTPPCCPTWMTAWAGCWHGCARRA